MTDIGEQCLRLVLEPFLVAKEEENDDHRSAKQVVVEITLENAEFNQRSYDEGHMDSCASRLTALCSITQQFGVQSLFQHLKPQVAFMPILCGSGTNIVGEQFKISNDALGEPVVVEMETPVTRFRRLSYREHSVAAVRLRSAATLIGSPIAVFLSFKRRSIAE